jgi:phosphoribosylaminoimidazole (AIR) synthetase
VVVVPASAAEAVAATLTAHGERVYRVGEVGPRPANSAQTVIN